MWQDNSDASSIRKDWRGAQIYCESLTRQGQSDWRLPTIKELQSIVDIKRYKPAIKKGFHYTASDDYWSASVCMSDAKYAWYVGFDGGETYYNTKSCMVYIRCVRSRQ